MKSWKKIGIFCLLCIVLLIGYLMPDAINTLQDRQNDDRIETVSTQTTQLQMGSDLSLSEKFSVLDHASSSVDLESAQNLEYEAAEECLTEELSRLFPPSADDPFSVSSFFETEHTITLCVYEEKSVLLWDFYLENSAGDQIHALLDDDSGLLLSFSYTPATEPDSDMFDIIEKNCNTAANEYLDSLAERYVEYLRASYNLSGTEISYEWALDELEDLLGESDDTAGIIRNSENASAAADTDTDVIADSSQTDDETEPDSLWTDTSESLRNYNPDSDTAPDSASDTDSDSDENTDVNQWITCIHFIRSDEESYTLELRLERNLLTIHNTD